MPISKDEWNKGRTTDNLEAKIESFLRANEGSAYTMEEIIKHLFQFKNEPWARFLGNIGSAFIVRPALENMVQKGIINSKTVEQKDYSDEYYMIA